MIQRVQSFVQLDNAMYVVAVGHAAAFAQVRVVDDDSFEDVEEGELIVAGAGVGEGYLGRPGMNDWRLITFFFAIARIVLILRLQNHTQLNFLIDLTAERFVRDENGTLWYRTGDTARFMANGEIAVIGRRKHMIKIRGFSVVPSAVEAVILRTIAASACVVRGAFSQEGSRGGRLV